MQIAFISQQDYDLFTFCEKPEEISPLILFPENISVFDLLSLLQASLDQIKPVLIVKEANTRFDIKRLTAKHFHLEKDQFIFLNYSIRNSLTRLTISATNISSFSQMYDLLAEQLIQKP